MKVNTKEAASGIFFMVVALIYGGVALTTLSLGTALNMGPGYFPLVLCILIFALGLAIALRGLTLPQTKAFGTVPWRAIIMLSAACFVFAAFIEDLGMLPGIFLTTLISSLAARGLKPLSVIAIAVGISAFCTIIFGYGIKLPIPVIGPIFDAYL